MNAIIQRKAYPTFYRGGAGWKSSERLAMPIPLEELPVLLNHLAKTDPEVHAIVKPTECPPVPAVESKRSPNVRLWAEDYEWP